MSSAKSTQQQPPAPSASQRVVARNESLAMAGEKVLVVDSSATVQELVKGALEEHGYRVTLASNGLAAVSHPEIETFDLIVIESTMEGIEGIEATRLIKTDKVTYKIPVLLLIPEGSLDLMESVPLKGATGWLAKPFTPERLLVKSREVIEEQRLHRLSEEFLRQSAESHMQGLAETKIQNAVEKKVQIIVERAIQSIVSIIDQRARREVDTRVTALTAEKEQELVKLTVQEVANSMVEKLADRKVTEAMDRILVETTETTVKRAIDAQLPPMLRERLREQIESQLPREIDIRINKAAEVKAAEIGEHIVSIISEQARKLVPLIAKESLPDLAERQVQLMADKRLPEIVQRQAEQAVATQIQHSLQPMITAEMTKIRNTNRNILIASVIGILVVALVVFFLAFILLREGIAATQGQAVLDLDPPTIVLVESNHADRPSGIPFT